MQSLFNDDFKAMFRTVIYHYTAVRRHTVDLLPDSHYSYIPKVTKETENCFEKILGMKSVLILMIKMEI